MPTRLDSLPGADLLEKGLADLELDLLSIEALLVLVGAPRLRRVGIVIPTPSQPPQIPEHALYHALEAVDARGVHSRYNALIRRLVSLERALELQVSLERRRVMPPEP